MNIRKLGLSLSASALLVICHDSLPSLGKSDSEQPEYDSRATLEANVDLKKKVDDNRQSYYWLLDDSGNKITALDYDSVMKFSEGLAAVFGSNPALYLGTGYIDYEAALAIPVRFANSEPFSEGLAWVWTLPKENGYINRDGRQVIRNKDFYQGSSFSEGLAAVRVRMSPTEINDGRVGGEGLPGKWGYINKTGKIAIAPKYEQAHDFHQGIASVRLANHWLLIDRNGNEFGGKYQIVGSFAEGLAPVKVGGNWGYVAKNGKYAFAGRFESARDFFEGLAAVERGGKYGFITASGKFVIEPTFEAVDHFSEGLCAVRTHSKKWGFINKEGRFVIPPTYDDVEAFSSQRALVEVHEKYGFIDRTGKYIVEPKYDSAYSYSDKRTVVSSRNWNSSFARSNLMSEHLTGLKIHKDASSPTGVYIPKDLDDALNELDAMLPSAAKEDVRIIDKSEMIQYHHGFGTWLRNNWGLWKGLRLAQYFRSLGIHHPDDISATILDSYWSKVHGQKEDVAEQAAKYKQYWDQLRPVVDVSVKLPAPIESTSLSDGLGNSYELKQVLSGAGVTVLSLCGNQDILSPKIIDALDQLRPLYPSKQLNLLAVTGDELAGTMFTIAKVEAGKITKADDSSSNKSTEPDGCLRLHAPGSLLQEFRHLLKLDSIVIPQTLVIQRDGTIVQRLNGFDEKTKANLRAAIDRCLAR